MSFSQVFSIIMIITAVLQIFLFIVEFKKSKEEFLKKIKAYKLKYVAFKDRFKKT